MIDNIYLDLDGVCCAFDSIYKQYTKEEWCEHAFEDFVNDKGFERLNPLPDAFELIGYLWNLKIPTTILSSAGGVPKLFEQIVDQKLNWLETHNINFPAIIVPSKEVKSQFSTERSVLIDDQLVNVNDFIVAGGFGIHHKSTKETIKELEKLL